jgi:hypothetical protein
MAPHEKGAEKPCVQCGKPFGPKDIGCPSNWKRQKFCSPVCMHAAKKYTPEQRVAAFWAKVDKSAGPDACWPWQGAITTHGYGCFLSDSRRVLGAHKVAYLYAKGDVPAGLEIMHACDNPPCCNPAHLSLGTRDENQQDKSRKGRCQKTNKWKLTYAKAQEIRAARGLKSSGELAKEYGITQSHVFTIWAGRVWQRPKQRNGWETGARRRAS